MLPFKITSATTSEVPILVSVPHCGTAFPPELVDQYKTDLITSPQDTDWFVDRLYDFAPTLGITMISAVYSRWVIDLNRDPESKPLYNDGRIITALCPSTTFLNQPLYKDNRLFVTTEETQRRLEHYYFPYHLKIQSMLDDLKVKFGKVLLWDCHSIKQVVPTIQQQNFPDLILGDVDGTSASGALIDVALKNLRNSSYSINHNHPFKGGMITRHFGKPDKRQHALQLEMTKVNYMDDNESRYDERRANQMRITLKNTFEALLRELLIEK
jgi:N-formylglutamate deformylase